MASKRKFGGELQALVPIKKTRQNEIAVMQQGGPLQGVS